MKRSRCLRNATNPIPRTLYLEDLGHLPLDPSRPAEIQRSNEMIVELMLLVEAVADCLGQNRDGSRGNVEVKGVPELQHSTPRTLTSIPAGSKAQVKD